MMPARFKNILVPVDFTVNTDLALKKAITFCQDEGTTLHLFHVQRVVLPGVWHSMQYFVAGYTRRQVNEDRLRLMAALEQIRQKIGQQYPGITVYTSVAFGEPVEEAILKKSTRLKSDLIVIGKKSRRRFLPFLQQVIPNRLAAKSGLPVLTVHANTENQEIKTVVIPISSKSPDNKLLLLEALRKTKLQVRLVTFKKDDKDGTMARHSLFQAIRRLKKNPTIPVDYTELPGTNKAKSLLRYCTKVGADVLIAHPDSETCVHTWTNTHISDILPKTSAMAVLTVR